MKPQQIKTPATPTDWGDVADWYDQLVGESGSEYHREVVLPGTLRLLAAKPGDHVLDLACGQGVLCRLLAAKQIEATGVDAAAELICAAKNRAVPEASTYSFSCSRCARYSNFYPPIIFHPQPAFWQSRICIRLRRWSVKSAE